MTDPAPQSSSSTLAAALAPGKVAVVTGGASGIGLAAARRLAALDLKVVIADLPSALDEAAGSLGGAVAVEADVADPAAWQRLSEAAEALGEVSVLMNNAGAGANPGKPWEDLQGWRRLLDINLWGAVHGVQAFVPGMLARGCGVVVNTGSKQGITLPPGNAAYNVSKAGLKAYTEVLAEELRRAGGGVSAHLLIPGFTFTGMTRRAGPDKPAGAWTAEQVAEFMLQGLERGDFYILCPDNDVTRTMDERRIAWAAGDIIDNRPALSRWHPDYEAAFAQWMKG